MDYIHGDVKMVKELLTVLPDTATGRHLPYGITHCCPTQVKVPTPTRRRVLNLPIPWGWKAKLTKVIRQWNGQESNWRPVDHKPDALTTTPPSHPRDGGDVGGGAFAPGGTFQGAAF